MLAPVARLPLELEPLAAMDQAHSPFMPPSPDPVWTRHFSAEEQQALTEEARAGAVAGAQLPLGQLLHGDLPPGWQPPWRV